VYLEKNDRDVDKKVVVDEYYAWLTAGQMDRDGPHRQGRLRRPIRHRKGEKNFSHRPTSQATGHRPASLGRNDDQGPFDFRPLGKIFIPNTAKTPFYPPL
jgi:hypothetical protein